MLKKVLVVGIVLINSVAWAQVDYKTQYNNARQLFREGKYNLAMETFKPLIPYDKDNMYAEYASFYYAVSAYHQGYMAVAKDQLNHIKSVYPKWEKMSEVDYWLGLVHIKNGDFFQAFRVFSTIQDRKFQADIDAAKKKALLGIDDTETLKMMYEEYPKDEIVARRLAEKLAEDISDPSNKSLLDDIISTFRLKRNDFIPEAPASVKKDRYAVSVMMPFMVNTLEPTPSRKRNQIVLDLYEGMKLAADTLKKMGVDIHLRAYDTERNIAKIKNLLGSDELRSTDLIVGPFFQEESKPLLDFSLENRVNVLNPFANNNELTINNPFSYLFQPSTETLGRESGEFLASFASKKNCLVIGGTTARDSALTESFVTAASANGLNIVGIRNFRRENVRDILPMLATPTELDDFKNPVDFTLKKDSLGSIFVATDDPLIYAKVISAIETRGDGIVVLGSEAWLENTIVDFEKYQTLPIVLAAPNFISQADPDFTAFVRRYIRTHGRVPSQHASLGYEIMMFAGKLLKDHGIYFQEALNKESFVPGTLYQGFNFQNSRNNQFVPFIRYQDGAMKVIEHF